LYGEFAPPEVKRRQTSTTPETVEQLLDPHRPRPYQAPAESLAGPYRQKNLERFWAWSTRVVGFASDGATVGSLKVQLVHSGAVVPRKERVSDSGYDLTLLYEKSRHGNVVLYGTGIIVEPPFGWYFDVVARSSIVKRGYMLANNVGIIDRSYRGEILVPLLRTDPQARELELPARIAQLIPRPIVHLPVEKTDELSATHRGAGGFGSTG
jgi:deoxyuridine 5'-triphosphate nucleotidohydrolase